MPGAAVAADVTAFCRLAYSAPFPSKAQNLHLRIEFLGIPFNGCPNTKHMDVGRSWLLSFVCLLSGRRRSWHSLWLFEDLLQIKRRNLTLDQFNLKVEPLINRKVRLLLKTFRPGCRINKLSGGDLRVIEWPMGGWKGEYLVKLFDYQIISRIFNFKPWNIKQYNQMKRLWI